MHDNISNNNTIYLDYNATTPTAPEVMEVISQVMTSCPGNPGSSHAEGRKARDVLENARCKVASAINALPEEIIFTSGGTESNNTVLLGVCPAPASGKGRLVTSRIEHPSVMNPCLHLMKQGWDVTFARVDPLCVVDTDEIEDALRASTALVSVMLANNETGAVQPLRKICEIAEKYGVPVHTDAAQALGKMPVDVRESGVDFLTIAGHKLYGPRGIGALYVKKGSPWGNLMFGAGQEQGMRPGTEPVPLAAGLGEACRLITKDLESRCAEMKTLRDRLYLLLHEAAHGSIVRHGDPDNVLCNTLFASFPHRSGREIIDACPQLMASTGSACHDRQATVSHVLAAMGVPANIAMGTLRLSLGRYTTEQDITRAAEFIGSALDNLTGS